MSAPRQVVVRAGHQPWGDIPEYHQDVFVRYVRADKRGHPNPRMVEARWQFWRCNNADCPAEFFVHDDAIKALIAEAVDLLVEP